MENSSEHCVVERHFPAIGPDYRLIELMFFGYRDFVGDADRVLAGYGFGRAHHRVLHFVHRNPALTVPRSAYSLA